MTPAGARLRAAIGGAVVGPDAFYDALAALAAPPPPDAIARADAAIERIILGQDSNPLTYDDARASRKRELRSVRLLRSAQRQATLRALQLAQRTPQRGGPCLPR